MIRTAIILGLIVTIWAGTNKHFAANIAAKIESNVQETVHDSFTQTQTTIIGGGLNTAADLVDKFMTAFAGAISQANNQQPQAQTQQLIQFLDTEKPNNQ